MKTKLFFLAAAFSIVSCTIKEDRLPCPCLLKLDFGIAARYSPLYSVKGWGYGESLFGESINLEDWPDGWSVRVPKGEIEYSAYSALSDCVMKGNAVIVPEGKGFDRIWACHKNLSLSEEETVDRVEPHKQWAEVTIQIKDLPEGELTTEITGNSIGFSLTDLRPVAGLFRTTISNGGKGIVSFNIPRQDDDGLNMVLLCEGMPVKTYELGKMIAGTGYDWNAEDLDDIYLGMDYNKLEMDIYIDPWSGGDTYNDAGMVSVIPFTDCMYPVRSSYGWDDSEINDLQLMLDDRQGNISMYYYPQFDGYADLTLEAGTSYRILAVANAGQRLERKQMEGMYDGIWKPAVSGLQRTGMPMSGIKDTDIISAGYQRITVKMTRMLAKVEFSIDRRWLKCPEGFKINSVSLYDGADGRFDYATPEDLAVIQNGGTISMYTYENLMGTLLPRNNDPWAKVPSSIGSDADRCTWLETKCSYDTGVLSSNDITYRMYLGWNTTTNFDVERNKVYSLTLIPSEEEIYGERGSWKISSSGWVENFTYRKRLEIINGGDLVVGGKAVFKVQLYTDTYFEDMLYRSDNTGETIDNDKLIWGFGTTPANMQATSQYASIDGSGTITGTVPGQCTAICVLPDDTGVFATKAITVHDTADELGIDLKIQWGPGNYGIEFDF